MGKRKQKDSFITPEMQLQGVLHDISSPLSIVQLNLDLIQENLDGQSRRELNKFLDKALLGMQQVKRMVINTRFKIAAQSSFSACEQLGLLCSLYKEKLKLKSILLEQDYREDKMLIADVTIFERIITNLLDNAISAFPDDSRLKYIKLRTSRSKYYFSISISDNGKGIIMSEMNKIFNKGYSSSGKGKGLGLFMIKKFMQEYFSGTVSCRSKVGEGTTFYLNFPGKSKSAAT